jgi:signal transduction histidine kinase
VIGAVYVSERDSEQAEVINSIQTRLRFISIFAGALALALIVIFSEALTARIRTLVNGMHVVREGDYAYRVPLKGRDEVRELSEEFNDMTGRLQATDELRRRFVSDASHELRTPLASIRLLSDSIVQSEGMDEPTMREFVTDIGSEAERLQRLTEKLMRLTKMDSHISDATEPVDMKSVAERTIHLLDPLAKKRDVTIYTEFGEGCVIRATRDDIYQIIFNLAENAIKYNSFGGNVFLRLHREGDEAVLTVEDTGIGIPEEDIPHIFDRFYRVDKARSRASGGSGLGLSIVRGAVEAHGGTIGVERRETIGTRFTVRFPALDEPAAEAPGTGEGQGK